jgi:hypothetical protein
MPAVMLRPLTSIESVFKYCLIISLERFSIAAFAALSNFLPKAYPISLFSP